MGMSVNSASSSSVYQTSGSSNLQQRRQDFKALSQALQSGDLAGAQKAFASLNPSAASAAASGSSASSTTASTASTSPSQALAQALQSGNLPAAQQAFAAMQNQTQTQGHHHHHHSQQPAAAAPATTSAISSTTSSGMIGSNINIAA